MQSLNSAEQWGNARIVKQPITIRLQTGQQTNNPAFPFGEEMDNGTVAVRLAGNRRAGFLYSIIRL